VLSPDKKKQIEWATPNREGRCLKKRHHGDGDVVTRDAHKKVARKEEDRREKDWATGGKRLIKLAVGLNSEAEKTEKNRTERDRVNITVELKLRLGMKNHEGKGIRKGGVRIS